MLSFFPLDILDEIWDLTVSVFEGFPTYSYSIQDDMLYNLFLLKFLRNLLEIFYRNYRRNVDMRVIFQKGKTYFDKIMAFLTIDFSGSG